MHIQWKYKDLNPWKSTEKGSPYYKNGNRNIGHFSHNQEQMKEESKSLQFMLLCRKYKRLRWPTDGDINVV